MGRLFSGLTPPDPDEIEFTLVGPGFGETALIHLGLGRWMVVDSCRHGRVNVPIDYLETLGVDVASQVVLVVATHFDKDHVEGLAETVRRCESARLVVPAAFGVSEVLQQLDESADEIVAASGSRSFRQAHLEYRHALVAAGLGTDEERLILALEATNLYRERDVLVQSWSPSSSVAINSGKEVAKMIRRLVNAEKVDVSGGGVRPNCLSIVLWIRAGDRLLLLGADMEHTASKQRGWGGVVLLGNRRDGHPHGRAEALKVPHHGSPGAHDDAMWTHLVSGTAIAMVAPWRLGGNWLPQESDLDRLAALCQAVWCTSRPEPHRVSDVGHNKAAMIHPGFVTLRAINTGERPWQVYPSEHSFLKVRA